MAKIEEKAKVGRPKLADPELIKDSWYKIASCLVVAIVMAICGIGVLTNRTPLEVLTFTNPNKVQANVANAKTVTVIGAKRVETKVIKPNKVVTKKIKTNGDVTYIIPANEAR